MKAILKEVYKFLEQINWDVTFENIKEHLISLGWKIIYFNTTEGDKVINSLNLSEKVNEAESFVRCGKTSKIIFINNNLSDTEKLEMLMHETAHIKCGHIADGELIYEESATRAVEAQAFVYHLTTFTKLDRLKYIIYKHRISLIIIFTFLVTIFTINVYYPIPHNNTEVPVTKITQGNEMVYVTPTGHKYHTGTCKHINKDTAHLIPIIQAKKSYTPCSDCNPNRDN